MAPFHAWLSLHDDPVGLATTVHPTHHQWAPLRACAQRVCARREAQRRRGRRGRRWARPAPATLARRRRYAPLSEEGAPLFLGHRRSFHLEAAAGTVGHHYSVGACMPGVSGLKGRARHAVDAGAARRADIWRQRAGRTQAARRRAGAADRARHVRIAAIYGAERALRALRAGREIAHYSARERRALAFTKSNSIK